MFSTADASWLMAVKVVKAARALKLVPHCKGLQAFWRTVAYGGEHFLTTGFYLGLLTLSFSLLLFATDAGTVCTVGVGCQDSSRYQPYSL